MLGLIFLTLLQFTSFNDGSKLLSGNWQSCRGDDGTYSERAFDYHRDGHFVWSFHMGPFHDFALFTDPTEDTHNAPSNLLFPNYVVENTVTTMEWNISNRLLKGAKDHLHIKVTLAGGSRDECESYFVEIATKP